MTAANILKGLQIIGKYCDLEKKWLTAEHDEIYFPDDPDKFSEEDIQEMVKLGFFIDAETDSLKCFV